MQRQAQAGFWVAGLLSLALPCASCLVTNELDFEANRSLLTVRKLSPPSPYPVPSTGSDECLGMELYFRASYFYEDVEQPLTVLPLVNGETIQLVPFRAAPDPEGSAEHVPPLICVALNALREPCNRVELFVSDDPDRLATNDVNRLRNDPRIVSETWFVFGPSADTPGGAGKPYTSFYDCLPPDGGI